MNIRKAEAQELPAIRDFYNALIDMMHEDGYQTAWEKDVYPSPDALRAFLESGSLFVGERDGKIIASMVLNSTGNESYQSVHWQVKIPPEDALVIHLLGVSLRCKGQGLGREMLRFAADRAKAHGKCAIRLDVHVTNATALKLYEKAGFEQVDTVRMFYEGIGWHEFIMCELAL